MNARELHSYMNDPANRFPWDRASEDCLTGADALDPDDHRWGAEYLREVAGSVRDHREGRQDPRH